MAGLDAILDEIIAREGGYVNNPDDRGGPTKYGVTQATLSAYLGRPASVGDVQGLDQATAKAIYAANYLHKPGIDKLPDLIQPVMLDAAVNSGPEQSVKFLQEVLNASGYGPLTVDGDLGPMTNAAAAKAAADLGTELNRRLIEKRRTFMQDLGVSNPNDAVFEKGWMARCDQLESEYA